MNITLSLSLFFLIYCFHCFLLLFTAFWRSVHSFLKSLRSRLVCMSVDGLLSPSTYGAQYLNKATAGEALRTLYNARLGAIIHDHGNDMDK